MSRACTIKACLMYLISSISISLFICGTTLSAEYPHTAEDHAAVHEDVSGSEGAGPVHGGDRSADLWDLFYRFMTVSLVVILLVVVARKARLSDYLSARIDEIRRMLEELQREKDETEKRCREMEDRLKGFESKRSELLEQYRQEGRAERDRIIGEATKRVSQIISQSELAVAQEIRAARNRVKQDVAEMAIDRAGEIIRKEITERDNDDIIDGFIERVRGSN